MNNEKINLFIGQLVDIIAICDAKIHNIFDKTLISQFFLLPLQPKIEKQC